MRFGYIKSLTFIELNAHSKDGVPKHNSKSDIKKHKLSADSIVKEYIFGSNGQQQDMALGLIIKAET
ncbi:hypothetical protein Lal_00025517 [Lupinus albus]|nr:hypothetical protein Lal_00025517 [Lupinus albus]